MDGFRQLGNTPQAVEGGQCFDDTRHPLLKLLSEQLCVLLWKEGGGREEGRGRKGEGEGGWQGGGREEGREGGRERRRDFGLSDQRSLAWNTIMK